jgi:hypothetical protein
MKGVIIMYRTKVRIIGLGDRISGENAKGSYDFMNVAFAYPDRKMEGMNCACLIVNGELASTLLVGCDYDAILDFEKVPTNGDKYKSVLKRIYFM